MEIIGRHRLIKLKKKNIGNQFLCKSIDDLILILSNANWNNKLELQKEFPNVDSVHEGFYFFNIHIHRTFVGINFEDGLAEIVWCGSHSEYEKTFKNNKDSIKSWLKNNGLIT